MGCHSGCIAVLRCLVIGNPALKTAFALSCEVHNEKTENDILGKSVVLRADAKVGMCDIFAENVMLAEYVWVRAKSILGGLHMDWCVDKRDFSLVAYVWIGVVERNSVGWICISEC